MISCETNGNPSVYHFVGAANMINIGKTAKREVQDYKLTRYACYLVALSGDNLDIDFFVQCYFAVQNPKFTTVKIKAIKQERSYRKNKKVESFYKISNKKQEKFYVK